MSASGPGGLFVTGTDTGVGKTYASCALLRALRARGLEVGAMKPVETGVGPEGPEDARRLAEACGAGDPLDEVCPQRFALPAAPPVAAAAEGRTVDLGAVRTAYARLRGRHRLLLVEGAGGLLVPAAEGTSMAELAAELGLPLLVVARAALGTINHTLLTLAVARARGLAVAGVVVCHADGPVSEPDAANLAALRRALGADLRGELLPGSEGTTPEALDVDALLRAALAEGESRPRPGASCA